MKLSCTSDLLCPGLPDFCAAVHTAGELGLPGVALSLAPGSPFTVDSFDLGDLSCLYEAQGHHVEIQCLYGLEIPALEPEAEILNLKKAILLAHAFDSQLVTVRPGFKAGERPAEVLVEILKEAADLGADLDVCLGLEPVAGSPCDSLHSALDLIDAADSSHLGLVYNPALHRFSDEKLPVNAAEAVKEYLLMAVLRQGEGGDVKDAHQALLLLHKAGFDDYVLCHDAGGAGADRAKIATLLDYVAKLSREERFRPC